MWHPPERIKHQPGAAGSPTADEAGASLLFSPLHAGRLVLADRTWVPAMVPWRATEDGFVTPDVLDWYTRFAAGQPGAIVVEATGVRDVASGPLLRIGADRFIPGLADLVTAVKRRAVADPAVHRIIDFLTIRRRLGRTRSCSGMRGLPTTSARGLAGLSDGDVRDRLSAMPTRRSARSSHPQREARFGLRSATDLELPHIRDLPDAAGSSPTPRGENRRLRRRRVHYARLPCVVSVAAEHARRRVRRVAGGARTAADRSLSRGPGRRLRSVRRRLPVSVRRVYRGRKRRRRGDLLRRRAGPGGNGLPVVVPGGQIRGREAAEDWRRRLSVHRSERLGVHADGARRRARAVRAQRRRGCGDPRRDSRRRARDPGRRDRRDPRVCAGRGDPGDGLADIMARAPSQSIPTGS